MAQLWRRSQSHDRPLYRAVLKPGSLRELLARRFLDRDTATVLTTIILDLEIRGTPSGDDRDPICTMTERILEGSIQAQKNQDC